MHIIRVFREDANVFERLWANILFNIGAIPLTPKHRPITPNDCQKLKNKAKAGDIILVSDGRRIGSFVIGRTSSHSMIATGNGTAIHAVGDGVVDSPMEDICKQYSYYVILRHNKLTENQSKKIVKIAKKHIGKPYDYLFNGYNRDAFFCTELVEHVFKRAYVPLTLKRSWRGVVFPSTLLKSQEFSLIEYSENLKEFLA